MRAGATVGLPFAVYPSFIYYNEDLLKKEGQPIPTKDWKIQALPLETIEHYVGRFIVFARMSPNAKFKVTALGTGLAGIDPKIMAQMFKYAPKNCYFDNLWFPYLTEGAGDRPQHNYWGTF